MCSPSSLECRRVDSRWSSSSAWTADPDAGSRWPAPYGCCSADCRCCDCSGQTFAVRRSRWPCYCWSYLHCPDCRWCCRCHCSNCCRDACRRCCDVRTADVPTNPCARTTSGWAPLTGRPPLVRPETSSWSNSGTDYSLRSSTRCSAGARCSHWNSDCSGRGRTGCRCFGLALCWLAGSERAAFWIGCSFAVWSTVAVCCVPRIDRWASVFDWRQRWTSICSSISGCSEPIGPAWTTGRPTRIAYGRPSTSRTWSRRERTSPSRESAFRWWCRIDSPSTCLVRRSSDWPTNSANCCPRPRRPVAARWDWVRSRSPGSAASSCSSRCSPTDVRRTWSGSADFRCAASAWRSRSSRGRSDDRWCSRCRRTERDHRRRRTRTAARAALWSSSAVGRGSIKREFD